MDSGLQLLVSNCLSICLDRRGQLPAKFMSDYAGIPRIESYKLCLSARDANVHPVKKRLWRVSTPSHPLSIFRLVYIRSPYKITAELMTTSLDRRKRVRLHMGSPSPPQFSNSIASADSSCSTPLSRLHWPNNLPLFVESLCSSKAELTVNYLQIYTTDRP